METPAALLLEQGHRIKGFFYFQKIMVYNSTIKDRDGHEISCLNIQLPHDDVRDAYYYIRALIDAIRTAFTNDIAPMSNENTCLCLTLLEGLLPGEEEYEALWTILEEKKMKR